eukprot:268965-Prymnesium_polylepis.3
MSVPRAVRRERLRRSLGGVVEGGVERAELLEREARDGRGVATGVDRVRVVGECRLSGAGTVTPTSDRAAAPGTADVRIAAARRAPCCRGARACCAARYSSESALLERLGRVFELVVPALLRHHARVVPRARPQHRVQVKALRNVCSEPLSSSANGSLEVYLSEPHNTECSRMCGTPVESVTGVGKTIPKTLLSSSACAEITSAPDLTWRYVTALILYSSTSSTLISSNAGCSAGGRSSTECSTEGAALQRGDDRTAGCCVRRARTLRGRLTPAHADITINQQNAARSNMAKPGGGLGPISYLLEGWPRWPMMSPGGGIERYAAL